MLRVDRSPAKRTLQCFSFKTEHSKAEVDKDYAIEGYTLMLRLEEIWPLLAREQAFPNWFTKLHL